MSIISGLTAKKILPYIEALQDNANFEEGSSTYNFLENIDPGLGAAARDRDPLMDKQTIKDYVFDYTDPLEYATLPFLAPKLAMKGKKIFDAVRGPGGNLSQNLRGIGAYIGTDILARDVLGYENPFGDKEDKIGSDPFFTQQEDGSFESTRPLPDAQDEAQEDLEDANKKEEEDKEDKEDKEDTKKEKGVKALGRFLESLGDSGSQSSSTPGYMIKGMGAATPQITRYQEGGIANIDPMMMANGGIAKFNVGKLAIKKGKEGIERLKDEYKKRKKTIKEKREAPKKSTKKSKSTDLVPYDEARAADAAAQRSRGFFDFLPAPIVAASSTAGRVGGKVGEVAKDYGKPIIGAGGLGLGAAGIYGLSQLGEEEQTEKEKADAQALLDKAAADKALKERQEAREGLTSMLDIIRARSLERAQAAGRTEPTFVDYVASFPASYSEKISKDPEFAKQMLAGFAAMGKTTEGYVTRNAFTDFTQGVQEERVRQDEGMSDQLKLLQVVQENPDIAKQLRNLNRPEIASTDLSILMSNVKRKVGDRLGVKLKDTDILVDPETDLPVSDLDLAALYNSDGPEAVLELSNRLIYKEV